MTYIWGKETLSDMLKISEKIKMKVEDMQIGTAFNYYQLGISPNEYSAAAKAIERLISKKVIKRASTGIFYKPKQSLFGELRPDENELLKFYLFKKNKRIAYVTGTSLYNKLGLTTQVPNDIQIASRAKRIITRIGGVKVKPVKSYVDVNDENYDLLELLDVIKDFTKIPDSNKNKLIEYLIARIDTLDKQSRNQLIRSALEYPPRVRALLGALLDEKKINQNTENLKKSLNPLSEYRFGINKKMLSTSSDWNIS